MSTSGKERTFKFAKLRRCSSYKETKLLFYLDCNKSHQQTGIRIVKTVRHIVLLTRSLSEEVFTNISDSRHYDNKITYVCCVIKNISATIYLFIYLKQFLFL